jgi:hypothetical protein
LIRLNQNYGETILAERLEANTRLLAKSVEIRNIYVNLGAIYKDSWI